MGRSVNLGQLYDMRGDGFLEESIEFYKRNDLGRNEKLCNICLVTRMKSDDQVPKFLNISKQQLLRDMCYPSHSVGNVIEFIFPPSKQYILLCYEKISKVCLLGGVKEIPHATHTVGEVDYGTIVLMRIIPEDEDVNVDELYESIQQNARHNPMLERCCRIETLVNWRELKCHTTIDEAVRYAELQMTTNHYCNIRYTLSSITTTSLWQQDDTATVSALKNLLRLEIAKNALENMLLRLNVKINKGSLLPLTSYFEEKVVNNLRNHKFFKFKELKQFEYINTIVDIFIQVYCFQLTCHDYMQQRYRKILEPITPNISHVLDTSLTLVSFCNDIHFTVDTNNIKQKGNILYFDLHTSRQEESMVMSNYNFVLIREERNLDLIVTDSFIWHKLDPLIAFLHDQPKTSYLRKEISNKNEKVFLHIHSRFWCFGIAKPLIQTQPAIQSIIINFTNTCRCKNVENRVWICYACKELIREGNGKNPICNCGKNDIYRMSLKCYNEYHGPEYIAGKGENRVQQLFSTIISSCSSPNKPNYDNDKIETCYEATETRAIHYHDVYTNKYGSDFLNNPISPVAVKLTSYKTASDSINFSNMGNHKGSTMENAATTIFCEASPIASSPKHSYDLRSKSKMVEHARDDTDMVEEKRKKQKQLSKVNDDKTKYLISTISKNAEAYISEEKHSNKTCSSENTILPVKQQVTQLNGYKITSTINVVVIGESGVGKSTLLNAISNYLKFDSSKDALENDLDYIIPCQFKVFNQDYSETIVSIGMPNENEIYDATVYSTTQDCKQHSFEFNGFKINFIDTPGLSDTSGIEKDAHNLEKIRDFICSLDYLHAICFVLKANESRMDVSFSNAMSDLLSIFPKSALSKVIFFMTHSRGTFFGPGDSMQPLTQFSNNLLKNKGVTFQLSSDNIFCVDNESFLYLCAKNQGIEYTGATMEDYENSWKKSKQACEKFFNKITKAEPLKIYKICLIKELRDVLKEQKQILSTRASAEAMAFHLLTAKALKHIELGNVAETYLTETNLKVVGRKIKEDEPAKIPFKNLFQGVEDFMQVCKNTSMPASSTCIKNFAPKLRN